MGIDTTDRTLREGRTGRSTRLAAVAAAGGLVAAFVTASACLIPLGAILLGVSGLGFLTRFAPLREPASVVTGALLALGFHLAYRVQRPGECRRDRAVRHWGRTFIWLSAGIAAAVNLLEYLVLPTLS